MTFVRHAGFASISLLNGAVAGVLVMIGDGQVFEMGIGKDLADPAATET
jgi:hypothetical protein